MIGITASSTQVFAEKYGYDGDDDDDINWQKFKNSETYEDADDDVQDYFKDAHNRGDNLAGYEVEN